MASPVDEDAMERGEAGITADWKEKHAALPASPTSTNITELSKGVSGTSQGIARIDDSNGPKKWFQVILDFCATLTRFPNRKASTAGRELIVRKFKECPRGYPHLAVFIDSDEAFMLYRRFGYLQARVLLNKQDKLRDLEKRLDKEDKDDAETKPKLLMCRDRDEAQNRPRVQLLKDIEECFKEYAELLVAAHTLAGFGKPSKRDYMSVKNYIDDEEPLIEEESEYVYRKEDLITVKPGRENAWLDGFVERVLQKISCRPVRFMFCSPEIRDKADAETILYDKDRISAIVTAIITLAIIALLIVPIYLLWHISTFLESNKITAVTIGVLLIFTLFFSTALSFFTRARRHEILGAAAAYCAVLVVFMANTNQKLPSGTTL